MNLTAQLSIGLYKHNKTGNEYFLVGHVINASSSPRLRGEYMVLYKRRDPDHPEIYTRPFDEFSAKFTLIQPARPVPNRCTCCTNEEVLAPA